MSTAQDDLQPLSNKLESWASLLPAEAQAFHKGRTELVREMRAVTGAFQRDPGAIAALHERFQELEESLPALQQLLAARERVRTQLTQLRALTPAKRDLQTAVQEVTDEWLALMDFLVRSTADLRNAKPAMGQLEQMEAWADERNRAVALIVQITVLRDKIRDTQHKNEIKTAIRDWTRVFCAGQADHAWRKEAEQTVKRFELWIQEEIKPEPRDNAGVSEPTTPEPTTPEPTPSKKTAAEIPKEQAAAAARLHFYRIDQMLAECRDLADALEYQGPEINDFTSLQWQLRNKPDAVLSEIQKVEDDIAACQQFLLKRAEEEADSRLHRLQRRWQWFKAVYGTRDELADLIRQAEDAKPEAAHRLRELFSLIQQAEQRVYAVVDGNRPKLAAYVRKAADSCRAEIEEIRQQARLTTVDAQLASLEQQIPEDPASQVPARQSFERLEKCYSLQQAIQKLSEENKAEHEKILAVAERLSAMVTEMAAMSEAAEIARIAAAIPRGLPPDRRLDEIAAELSLAEKLLEAHRADIQKKKSAELAQLRKENLAWIRLLADFAPEAEALAAKDPPPEDLDRLRGALEIEQRYHERIADLLAKAAERLVARRRESRQRLNVHLETPAFETHPERDAAEQLLRRADSLVDLTGTPKREEFSRMYEVVSEVEGFLDRIESARRSIPERLKKLEERFEIFRERNGIVYRPEFARRANSLLLGIHKALEQEQWEPLNYQLAQTDALLSALERDGLIQISAETEDLVERLKVAAKRSTDQVYGQQVETALKQLEDQGQLEPPTYALRQRLNRLLSPARSTIA